MGKRIICILIFILSGNFSFGQKDSSNLNHSVYYSSIIFDDYSVHSMLGYQINFGKNQFFAGLSIDRKKQLAISSPNLIFYYMDRGYEVLNYYRRGGNGIRLNNFVVGYNYLWGKDNRLKLIPLAFLNFYNYTFQDVFDGQIEPGIYGQDPYKIKVMCLGINGGFSFKFDLSKRFTITQDFNLGHYFIYNSYESQYFGYTNNVYHYWVAGGSFRVSYRLGK